MGNKGGPPGLEPPESLVGLDQDRASFPLKALSGETFVVSLPWQCAMLS